MAKSLKDDIPEIVVATPGRFIELIKMKGKSVVKLMHSNRIIYIVNYLNYNNNS